MADHPTSAAERIAAARGPARHERPMLDAAGLDAARHADRLLAAAESIGNGRWVTYFETIPDRLRDDEPAALRKTAMRARSAYGPKDSVRDTLPADVTEPFLESVDRLLREINRTRI